MHINRVERIAYACAMGIRYAYLRAAVMMNKSLAWMAWGRKITLIIILWVSHFNANNIQYKRSFSSRFYMYAVSINPLILSYNTFCG